MSEDTIQSKIDLLKEQIDNLETSGHFTEKEIDSKAAPLKMELAILKHSLSLSKFSNSIYKYGLTLAEFQEASINFDKCMAKALLQPNKNMMDMAVVDAEVLTQNHQEV